MTQQKPNIIFLVLDTHRAERMSVYGYHKDTTPVLEHMAGGSTVFDWAVAPAPWTIPSHASMFTGLYPTVHQTVQSYSSLPANIPTLAELLAQNGYDTVGFCNNPLVGVLDNGLRRGFQKFYNYSGTFPDVADFGQRSTLKRMQLHTTKLLQKISVPIERKFGQSPLLLKLAMLPVFVPIWSRTFNFKGNTQRSLRDVRDYLHYRHTTHRDHPFFMFINMMETHLPYYPPRKAVDRWLPYLRKDREARAFVNRFNIENYRWMTPLVEPLTEMQQHVLSDMYDAEVAYQDRQLHRMFRYLRRSGMLDNTMVIVISDHGESIGEHEFMGHSVVIYNELVRVPLFIHYPQMFPAGVRVQQNVSTRRIFHTVLEAAGVPYKQFGETTEALSLSRSANGSGGEPEGEYVVAEGFPPQNLINVMEMTDREAIERFRIRQVRRAIYQGDAKLMTVGGRTDEFFNVRSDPMETVNLLNQPIGYENDILRMEKLLDEYILLSEAHRDGVAPGARVDYSDNPELLERLRGLGYIE